MGFFDIRKKKQPEQTKTDREYFLEKRKKADQEYEENRQYE